MTSRDFCYWLQGYLELRDPKGAGEVCGLVGLSQHQTECVQKHLALVFKHEIDPSMGTPEKQAALDKIHHHELGIGGAQIRC